MGKVKKNKGAGTLIKRGKKGNYYLRYYIDGKQTTQRLVNERGESITVKEEAEEARANLLAPLTATKKADQLKAVQAKLEDIETQKQRALDALKPRLKLDSIWQAYLKAQNRERSGDASLTRYRSSINAFTMWMKETFPEVLTMREVTPSHTEAYARHLNSKKLAPTSFNVYLNCLTTVWTVLQEKGDTTCNPFAWDKSNKKGIRRKNILAEADTRKKRALTLEEVNAVIAAAKGDYRTLMIILACTGQRLIDGIKLQWKEIDLQNGVITIKPRKTATTTGKIVLIPLLPQLRTELESLIPNGPYVLPELVELYDRYSVAISRHIRTIFNDAGLNAHKDTDLTSGRVVVETGAHSFRHSYVTIARMAGIPDTIIQSVTGHSSLKMVDHYTSITPEIISRISAAMPTALLGDGEAQQKEPMPDWIREKLELMDSKNWENVVAELLEMK